SRLSAKPIPGDSVACRKLDRASKLFERLTMWGAARRKPSPAMCCSGDGADGEVVQAGNARRAQVSRYLAKTSFVLLKCRHGEARLALRVCAQVSACLLGTIPTWSRFR